jgi:21S rRNA (GM2251-2'-O)-methyltransferase
MLPVASARALCMSRWLLHAKLPPRRYASLTGAIRRGARNTSAIRDRSERPTVARGLPERGNYDASQPRPFRQPGSHETKIPSRTQNERGESAQYDASRPRTSSQPRLRESKFISRQPDRHREYRQREQSYGEKHEGSTLMRREMGEVSRSDHGQSTHPSHRRQPGISPVPERDRATKWPRQANSRSPSQDGFQTRRAHPPKNEDSIVPYHRQADPGLRGQQGRRPFPHKSTGQERSFDRDENVEGALDDGLRELSSTKHKNSSVPMSIPRSVAASEFIYGASAVKAALQAGTRKFYKLYISQSDDGLEERLGDRMIGELAAANRVPVKRIDTENLRLLDKMAQGRPHNGFVLEASKLPTTPVEALGSAEGPGTGFSFIASYQSAEEIAVNSASTKVSSQSHLYPFVLLLDSILDPGNLGAIIRTAAFFGVDAIAVVDYSLAPFSPVTLKASAGAAEHMRYLSVKKDVDFVKSSQLSGWKFFAAVAPNSASARRGGITRAASTEIETALAEGPCVLMLGGEGDGIRARLQKTADRVVGIEGARGLQSQLGLDSLNVSVAAGLLIQKFVGNSHSGRQGLNETQEQLLF